MGLTKQYLRYAPGAVFGLVASARANAVFVALRGERSRFAAVATCEYVVVWDLRKGEKVLVIPGDKSEVTRLAAAPCRGRHGGEEQGYAAGVELAAGHVDGAVRLLSLITGEKRVTFTGHRTAITALAYHPDGTRLVSGSQDTDVIVWDVVGECGLYRLKGHKDAVTSARFFSTKNVLLTGSKDSFVKFWDLDTQHCFKTLVGHRSEVWSLATFGEDTRLVTGSADSELRVWELLCPDSDAGIKRPRAAVPRLATQDGELSDDANAEEEEEEERIVAAHKLGSLLREGRDRVVSMATDPTGRFLVCHGLDQTLEVFRIQTEEEIKKVLDKRRKKQRKRAARNAEAGNDMQQQEEVVERTVQDEIVRVANIRASAKIRSVDVRVESGGRELRVVLVLANNLLETHVVVVASAETRRAGRVVTPGHRSDVRTVAFSSDNTAVLSASGESAKIWNRASLQCVRSMDCQYALSSLFVPGDRQVVLASKTGKLQLFDLASGLQMECVDAHDGAVWSLCMAPDQRGFVSGGADKLVKFWEFELVKSADAGQASNSSSGLTLTPSRALSLDEEVLCVRFTPDHRLLCVSLLDCTVKAFYTDSLKFFLNLFGHKLPVLCMDISYDSRLIATGSSDRNVKIWGLDFGDCHRSLFAHDDSVMCLQFVPKTHLFFTAGKDGKIKQWDADKFELVQTLEGHHGEVWSVAVSPSGDHILSAAHDKSLRLWERTREPLVLEDEREMEREAEYEESVAKGAEPIVPGETEGEAGMAARKTMETVKAAERIMEALELYRVESQKLEEHKQACKAANKQLPPPVLDPVLVASGSVTPEKYVLEVIKKVKSSELEEALLVLPFSYVPELLALFLLFLRQGRAVELICRALFFLLRIHHGQITSNGMLLEVISELRESSLLRVREMRDLVGFNMAALQLLHREIEAKQEVALFVDATQKMKDKKRKRKVREKQRAVLALAL
ncbi:LOW QUALITY PROTEIN: WD repeat-containing protein 3 [Lethenteron reissneri]|uniref:LOW QUALITY PROTEIN: WD repeat-containing protein 3 n=1 Tax=Lethenteron reissneri TaxID=7753 RepID=UPI002AB711B8|nr:LOW QUALITY PROTEIN: WD repeat-containing protein 3 [Lethenteron reissneri]